ELSDDFEEEGLDELSDDFEEEDLDELSDSLDISEIEGFSDDFEEESDDDEDVIEFPQGNIDDMMNFSLNSFEKTETGKGFLYTDGDLSKDIFDSVFLKEKHKPNT
ncbi:MAG: hypothetical protein QG635_973, partial [Bacteroidota bacterium]|nr:hypothetical protein [Bacteroidota bacterium]